MESRDLRINDTFTLKSARKSFDSLCSLRMTKSKCLAPIIPHKIYYLVGGVMTPPYDDIYHIREVSHVFTILCQNLH